MLLFHLSRIISKNKAPFYGGRKIFRSHLAPPIHTGGNLLLAAAHAIVVAATAATVTATAAVAANQTVVAAAAEQQNKNDNPSCRLRIFSRLRMSVCLRAACWYSAAIMAWLKKASRSLVRRLQRWLQSLLQGERPM